jgi:hypothetical protein
MIVDARASVPRALKEHILFYKCLRLLRFWGVA